MTDRPTPPASANLLRNSSSLFVAILLALAIRSTVVQAFYIPSGSMEDTLFVGDYLLANKFIYGAPLELPLVDAPLLRFPAFRDPHAGDIVIFRSLEEAGLDLIKRCVAAGGQTVEVRNKVLYVDGVRSPPPEDGKVVDQVIYSARVAPRDNFGPLVVPEDHFFMMGDNR
ncbi:MAG: signal peptidase I, partial [Gemmatimonadetes bacterium]|nr:signal peptidase I [Gemmatimonadota bacterium]